MLCHSVSAFIFPFSTLAPTFPSSSVNDFQLFFNRYYYYYHSQPFLLSHHQLPFILSYPPFYTMILSWTFLSNPFAYECDLPALFFFLFSCSTEHIFLRYPFVLSTCVWHGSSFEHKPISIVQDLLPDINCSSFLSTNTTKDEITYPKINTRLPVDVSLDG